MCGFLRVTANIALPRTGARAAAAFEADPATPGDRDRVVVKGVSQLEVVAHGSYWYLRYEEYDRRTGKTRYRREYVPKSELARVRAWVRCFRTNRARERAVLVQLRSLRRSKRIPCAPPRAELGVSALLERIAEPHASVNEIASMDTELRSLSNSLFSRLARSCTSTSPGVVTWRSRERHGKH